MKFAIRSAARDDILRQYRYYLIEQDAETAAERFLAAIRISIRQICQRPEIGVRKDLQHPALAGLRSWPVKGFPAIRIYYLRSEKQIRIVRVIHGRRDFAAILDREN